MCAWVGAAGDRCFCAFAFTGAGGSGGMTPQLTKRSKELFVPEIRRVHHDHYYY